MLTKQKYEEEILRKVQALPEAQLPKVISLLDKLENDENKRQDYLKVIDELRGKYKDGLSSSEDFMRRKQEEKNLDF
jgi:hypothetical protein